MENPVSPKSWQAATKSGRFSDKRHGTGVPSYDTVVRREVAVKTILDIPDPASLQLFYKECDVLASMSHPTLSRSSTLESLKTKARRSLIRDAAVARHDAGSLCSQGEPSPNS